jgi:hypothetical protein
MKQGGTTRRFWGRKRASSLASACYSYATIGYTTFGYDARYPAIKHASDSAPLLLEMTPALITPDTLTSPMLPELPLQVALPPACTAPSPAATAATIAVTSALTAATPCLCCAGTCAIAAAIENTAPSRLGPVSILPQTLPSKEFSSIAGSVVLNNSLIACFIWSLSAIFESWMNVDWMVVWKLVWLTVWMYICLLKANKNMKDKKIYLPL